MFIRPYTKKMLKPDWLVLLNKHILFFFVLTVFVLIINIETFILLEILCLYNICKKSTE